jgi:hypothetical protein
MSESRPADRDGSDDFDWCTGGEEHHGSRRMLSSLPASTQSGLHTPSSRGGGFEEGPGSATTMKPPDRGREPQQSKSNDSARGADTPTLIQMAAG